MRIAPGQTSSCTNPTLDVWVIDDTGMLFDPLSIEFQIFSVSVVTGNLLLPPSQVVPGSGRTALDLDDCPSGQRLGKGHFVIPWDVPGDQDIGRYEIRSFVVMNAGDDEIEFRQEFDVASIVAGTWEYILSSVSEMREEGISADLYNDLRVFRALRMASRMVEKFTQNLFMPKRMILKLDGDGTSIIETGYPIIAIEEIKTNIISIQQTDLEEVGYRVYNRHLKGFLDPDDREYPRVEIMPIGALGFWPWNSPIQDDDDLMNRRFRFPKGRQNVTVTGLFGYTDPDGSSTGGVPDEVKWATRRLALRYLPQQNRRAQIYDFERAGAIIAESTRDQSQSFSDKRLLPAPYTGDPQIDSVLIRYGRSPAHRVA